MLSSFCISDSLRINKDADGLFFLDLDNLCRRDARLILCSIIIVMFEYIPAIQAMPALFAEAESQ